MRKSIYITLTTASLLIASAFAAKAVTFSDTDSFATKLSIFNPVYSGTFDITSPANGGYDPDAYSIYSAVALFALSDDQWLDPAEWVSIELNGQDFLGPIEVDLGIVGGQVVGQALLTLNQTGQLSYTIIREAGDFWALGAKLVATGGPKNVPDGGATLMLLGGALAGIEALRRRVAKKHKKNVGLEGNGKTRNQLPR